MEKSAVEELVSAHRRFFLSQTARDLRFRLSGLRALKKCVHKYESELCAALWRDLHKSSQEAFLTEISVVLSEIGGQISRLKRRAATQRVSTPLFLFGSRSRIRHEPYGVVAILSPWNYPFQLLFGPLAGALAAGNSVVLKPSPRTPEVNAVMARMVAEVFPLEQVSFLEGGADVAQALLEQPLDYIFFTGSTASGQQVMAAAARNLTPVTLELGGKSPCVVDASAHVEVAARRIAWGKFLNAGQTCVAPDYLWVHRSLKAELIGRIREAVRCFYGDNPRLSPYYGRMIGSQEVERMQRFIDSATVVFGGETDPAERYVAPTLLDGVALDSLVMQQEIFGPVLPLLEFDDLDREVIPMLQQQPKPLALYYFGEPKRGESLFDRVDSGGGCINDVVLHLANPALPFGGVGKSGIGQYHGRYSFETFSRCRSVLVSPRRLDFPAKYPPYAGFDWIRKLL